MRTLLAALSLIVASLATQSSGESSAAGDAASWVAQASLTSDVGAVRTRTGLTVPLGPRYREALLNWG